MPKILLIVGFLMLMGVGMNLLILVRSIGMGSLALCWDN
jgi:hypothetical protein